MRRPTVRISLIVALSLVVALVIGVRYAVENILPYSPIRPHRVTRAEMETFAPNLLSPSDIASKWENFDITVEDSIRLKGWFIHSATLPARGTILILHGIASTRMAMLAEAGILSQSGYHCILYDSRANGESGGLNCTFGYYEKHDVSAYIDAALAVHPDAAPFGIIGDSLGAAVSLQALASDKRLVCGIAESPFATLREVVHDYFRQMFFLPMTSIPDAVLKRSEQIAHFRVDGVCPACDARNILQPTLIVHGEDDNKIAADQGRRVFDNLASPYKEFYLVKGAGHDDLAAVGGLEYRRRILQFFARYMVADGPHAGTLTHPALEGYTMDIHGSGTWSPKSRSGETVMDCVCPGRYLKTPGFPQEKASKSPSRTA
jgi:pimeloyl-ACP methyl ester carboxylesterase